MNCFTKNRSWLRSIFLLLTATITASGKVLAAGPRVPSELESPLAIALLLIMIGLLVAIGILCYVVIGAAKLHVEKLKEQSKTGANAIASKVASVIVLCLLSTSLFAQTEPVAGPAEPTGIGGLSTTSFNTMAGVIALEVLLLIILTVFLQTFLAKEKVRAAVHEAETVKEPLWKTWWIKLNSFKPVKEEAAITLNHDYDGIHELDNKLPPWWLYGFYACVAFACIYLYRFHVSHTAPSSLQEYEAAVAQTEIEKQEYLETAASKVDETTVALLTDAAALESGKKLFTGTCAACHGAEGQGIVGPNLTDDYWLHKGGIKDVFKTIKYGVPEKGMKSWKDDFSPAQIAELASYIKSIHGTKPPAAKEPQGDLYKEETAVADSTVAVVIK